jgi:pimeloyl-ACP methyl ester carboxylesterase
LRRSPRSSPGSRPADHEVWTLSLTGLDERVHLATPDIDLETHITDVVDLITYEDLRDVTLVGYSNSATVVVGVAKRAPELLALRDHRFG